MALGEGRTPRWKKPTCVSHGKEQGHLPTRNTHYQKLRGRSAFVLCMNFQKRGLFVTAASLPLVNIVVPSLKIHLIFFMAEIITSFEIMDMSIYSL